MKALKQALNAGDPLLGMWAVLASPYAAEICATSGFDWLLIDAEHGPNDVRSVLAQLQAVAAYDVQPVIRIPNADSSLIKRYLDIGATNILAPFVNSAEDAIHLVKSTRYPPNGIRGSGSGLARVSRWGGVVDYVTSANDDITLIVQIETKEALDNLEAICAVDGVDGVFFGPADIAASFGYLGQSNHHEVISSVLDGIAVAKKNGMPSGIFSSDPTFLEQCVAAGAVLLGVASDTGILAGGARRAATDMRSRFARRR